MQKVFFIFCCLYAASCEELTLKRIYFKSNEAIESRNTLKSEKILKKYFITTKRNNSVWNIAQIMAKQVFNITYRISDLSVMEQDIQKISRGFLDCEKLTKNKLNSSLCFSELAITLEDAIRDFKSSSPSTSRRNRVKYATMFMTMVVFQAHIALIAKNSPLPHKTNLNKRYSFIFEKINANLNQFEFRSEDWRISASQVTPVTICEIHVIMWIEFQGACEKRWRRSVDEENFGLGTSYDNGSLIDNKVERIGNPNPHKMKYRATVYDKFASYQVFQEDALVDSSSRGVGIFELFKKGNSRRLKYNEGIANQVKRFNEDLVSLVRSIVESTIALF